MNRDLNTTEFTRTSRTWSILILAIIAWTLISLWSFRVAGFSLASLADNPAIEVAELDVSVDGQQAESTSDIALAVEADNQMQAIADTKVVAEEQVEADVQARLAAQAAAEEQARIAEQAAAEEQARIAEQAAAEEQARLAEQAAAEEQARIAEQAAADEQARIAEQAAAEEQARIAEQAAADEQARLAEQAAAEEQARLAEQAAAEEQARLAEKQAKEKEEAQVAEQMRLAVQNSAAQPIELEQQSLTSANDPEDGELVSLAANELEQIVDEVQMNNEDSEQLVSASDRQPLDEVRPDAERVASPRADSDKALLTESQQTEQESAQRLVQREAAEAQEKAALAQAEQAANEERLQLATAEQARSNAQSAEARAEAAAAKRLAAYRKLREEELRVLIGQSNRIRFEFGSSEINKDIERPLDRMFDPLFLYSEMPVVVTVAANESDGLISDNALSMDRGDAIVTYLTDRGLERSRFTIRVESGEDLLLGTHRVRVVTEEPVQ